MTPALRKIAGDLRSQWGRVLLLVAAVAIGQAALTAAVVTRSVLAREIARDFGEARAPDVTVELTGLDPANTAALAAVPGVVALDARVQVGARLRREGGPWIPVLLSGVRDFQAMPVSRVVPTSGAWPPAEGQVLIERSGLDLVGAKPGEGLEIVAGPGQTGALTLAGAVHDPSQAPSWQEHTAYGYVTLPTLTALAGPGRPVQLRILAGEDPAAVGRAVARAAVARGATVQRITAVPPAHPHADLMQGELNILAMFAAVAFVLALSLGGSVVAGLTQRQERQFAVLRALGASAPRIALMHLAFVLPPAILGVALGAAAGAALALPLEAYVAWQLNIDLASQLPSPLLAKALLVTGLIGALVAALSPVLSTVRRPVREGLQPGSSGKGNGVRIPLPAPLDRLAVAEAFRRPRRTAVAVLALALGGAALITAANLFGSLVGLVDRSMAARHDDIEVVLAAGPTDPGLAARVAAVPGVRHVEFWGYKAVAVMKDGVATQRLPLIAPVPGSTLGRPPLVSGRWPSGPGEVAVSAMIAGRVAGGELGLGRSVTLNGASRTATVRIVGLTDEFGGSLWTNPATFAALADPGDDRRDIRAVLEPGRGAAAIAGIERAVLASGSYPGATTPRETRRAVMVDHFATFYDLLMLAAGAAALVGAAALSATVSANVLERTREIGVLRALGAQPPALARLVTVQGLAIAALAMLLAVAVAMPLSWLGASLLATKALHLPLPLIVSWPAMAGWALASVVVVALAAVAPTLRLARMPVREAVAYE